MAESGASRPSIFFLEVEPWEEDVLRGLCPPSWDTQFSADEADRTDPATVAGTQVLSVFIYSDLSEKLLGKMPALRMIATRSTGYDHIDLGACRQRGIVVANVPAYGANTVAEHTFALMLALSRKVYEARSRTMRGDFSFHGLRGFDLKDKVLGVIGSGRIGQHVIRIAKGFQMRLIVYDAQPDSSLSEVLGFEYANLDELLARSDLVTLHCPLTDETHHLIDRRAFERMKRGVVLINTARGGLINTDDLVWALEQGIVGGAGLDVLEHEQEIREERELLAGRFDCNKLCALVRSHALLHDDRVLITPHIGFNSQEAVERILRTTVGNISAFFAGTPRDRVA